MESLEILWELNTPKMNFQKSTCFAFLRLVFSSRFSLFFRGRDDKPSIWALGSSIIGPMQLPRSSGPPAHRHH